MYRVKQLKVLHWLTLMLVAINLFIVLTGFEEEQDSASQHEIIYPPNLVSIILINTPEYDEYLSRIAKEEIVMLCYEMGPFIEKEYVSAVMHHLTSRKLDVYRKTDVEKEKIGYWVYLDPERSRALGRLKVEEIKLKGLTDVMLLTQNNPRYAISLGFFKAKEFATRRLIKAQSLGLDAKLDVRYKNQDYQWLIIKTTDKNDLSQHEWSNILHDYKDIELKTVNCQ